MHFYFNLITRLFPFVAVIGTEAEEPPIGQNNVIDYLGNNVITFNGDNVIVDEV